MKLFFIILLFSCSGTKHLSFVNKSSTIKTDSIHLKFTGDSLTRDTVRYFKQDVLYNKSPYLLRGQWYYFLILIAGAAVFIWLKK